jgi:NADP-dependent 3-hydroxy acid dehydrogenase YdfG
VALGTVLITGASTGIGEATAHHLKELGFDAVGAVRRPHDAERLRSAGLRTVTLDLTGRDARRRGPMAAVLPDRLMDRLIARAMSR